MKSINRVELAGVVGTSRLLSGGNNVGISLSVATEINRKQNDGTYVAETTWHDVTAWKAYGICDPNTISKGTKVYVSGRLNKRKYTDKDGRDVWTTEVVADRLFVIDDPKPEQANQSGGTATQRTTAPAPSGIPGDIPDEAMF